MDFFTQQDRARRQTKWLVGYFVLAMASITGMVYLVVSLALGTIEAERGERGLGSPRSQGRAELPRMRLRADVLGWVALGTLVVVGTGSLWRLSELSSGGASVATMLGGQAVAPNTRDPEERKLLNVVEEMAIASGVPVPPVYLVPDDSINAFAAGYQPSDAVVGVTRGCMRLLNRDELQGVIAHEFSHILNGDMRLNLRLVAWIFGIMGLALVGRILLHTRGRKNALPLVGLALMLIGWVGVLFGRLIQSAVSRQREFLADASAVQFTRNPQGLASALKKIGGLSAGSQISSAQAAEVSHMFFANGLRSSLLTPFATHPPLTARIRALEPGWDGVFPRVRPPSAESEAAPPIAARRRVFMPPVTGSLPGMLLAEGQRTGVQRIGEPTPVTLQYAADWRESLPPQVEAAAREPFGAEAVIFALLLSADPAVRRKQVHQLAGLVGEAMVNEMLSLQPAVVEVAARARLPLVDLCLPTLRELSAPQFQLLEQALQTLIEADQQIDLFEYTLQRVVRRHLASTFDGARRKPAQYYALKPLLPDCAAVLKLFAHVGAASPAAAEAAWRSGWNSLGASPPPLPPPAGEDLIAFDAALARLDLAAPQIKRSVLTAAAHTVGADGEIREREAELLRAVGDTLDCPIPPLVQLGSEAAVVGG
jgi:Zn-dependent protease with chaperone function